MSNPLNTQVGGDHYRKMRIQPITFITLNGLNFLEGSIIKRICRWQRGGKGKEDLLKARHEIDLLLSFYYPEEQGNDKVNDSGRGAEQGRRE